MIDIGNIEIKLQNIIINSPQGSGNIFASFLLKKLSTCKQSYVYHEPDRLTSGEKQVVFIRNPYDSIASATERHLDSVPYRFINEKISIDDKKSLKEFISDYIIIYKMFINRIDNNKNLLIILFEDLSSDPIDVAKKINTFFNFEFIDQEKNFDINSYIYNEMLIANQQARSPRKRTESRETIEALIKTFPDIKNVYNQYLKVKEKLQLTKI